MPFHNGAYYPYTVDTQGTHSSAGIPSLLNSPLSQHSVSSHSVPAPGMTPSSGASTILPFKFRPRRESVDWRRINAVDIDLVVTQLDVDALQEHISMVTFCSLEGERCQRCQSPVDPALVKLLQLAQLTVEWLLYCQEFLTLNLHTAEERLAAARSDREQLLAQYKKQEEKVKMLTAELKQRKKVIRTQQSLLAPRIISSHKCPHCDKNFVNSSFLQNHVQRRHPDEYDTQLRSDSDKKSQIHSLKLEISSLKEQIAQQQQTLTDKTAQQEKQQDLQKEMQRELERFRTEDMTRMERKIQDSTDGVRRQMEFLCIQKIQEANQNQTSKHEKPPSPVQSQPERDQDIYKEMHMQAIQKLEHQMKKQDKKWEHRLQEIQAQHESEKNQLMNELGRMRSHVAEQEEHSKTLQQEMGRRLQERELTIKAQKEQIRNITSHPPTKIVEVPVIVSVPVPEPKPKRVVLDSSISECRPVEKKPEVTPEKKQKALKKNPNIKKETRLQLEQAVMEKLEHLGVKPDQSGLKNKELTSLLAKVNLKRENMAKEMPDYWRHWEDVSSTVEQKLGGERRGSDPAPESEAKSRHSGQVLQIRPRSSSLPSRATQVTSALTVKQPKTPQPAPRTKTTTIQPKTSTPNSKTSLRSLRSKTPPFSSDEESEQESESMDMELEQLQKYHQRGKTLQSRLHQAPTVQIRSNKPGLVQVKQTPARHPFSSLNLPQPQLSGSNLTTVTKIDSEDDEDDDIWSDDGSELHEIDVKQLQSYKDQNGNVDKRNYGKENKINDLVRKVETQLVERSVKKPAGGVSILPERKDEVQELTYTDLEESSDWMVSSLEDRQEKSKPAHGSAALRKGLDSPSTSVWGTSTGKAPKSGLTDAGTGSTLKSSFCTLSDLSESEDNSNKVYS